VQKILKPDNGEMYLAEMPPNVEAAIGFRRHWNFGNKRELMLAVAENHVRTTLTNSVTRSVMTLMLCRTIIPICQAELNFRLLTETNRAFPDFDKVLGETTPIQKCGSHKWYQCAPRLQKPATTRNDGRR
jgi:hypothetical protein